MAHRLLDKAPRIRSFLGALSHGLTLFVVGNVWEHRRQQDKACGAFGKLECLDTERLIGQLLRLAAAGCDRSIPNSMRG
jgi:hypothetical protein